MGRSPDVVQQSPLSIVVGVTGHRDPRDEDIPRLEGVFRDVLIDQQARYPHSSIVVMSALADGADRLAARVALDLGMSLVVPLPLPRLLYARDFTAPGSLDEFEALTARARGVVHLPLLPGATPESVSVPGPARDREYAKVGAYIARHSQVFVAFWDGTPETEFTIGGTAQTVAFRLRGVPTSYGWRPRPLSSAAAEGAVLHIDTPRRSGRRTEVSGGRTWTILPSDGLTESYDHLCERMDAFNADAASLKYELRTSEKVSRAQLLSTDAESAPALFAALPRACREIADQYATADGLALHFGQRTRTTWKRVFRGLAVAALLLQVHAAFYAVPQEMPASFFDAVRTLPWFLLAFLAVSTFTAAWLYRTAQERGYQTKHQDYRALAEALRIQFYWRVTGVPEPVVENYLRKQRSELEWIRSALKSCDVLTSTAGTGEDVLEIESAARFQYVALWIQDQRRYFAAKARSEEGRLHAEGAAIRWLLRASGAVSAALTVSLVLPSLARLTPIPYLPELLPSQRQYATLMVVIPFMAICSGLLDSYRRQLARAEHVRQFTRMSELFMAGDRDLDELLRDGRFDAALALVRELGIEALDENGDWLTLHRERPLEIPPG